MNESEKAEARKLLIGGKTDDGKSVSGAYQHLVNVFVRYPTSTWALDAAERADEIREALIGFRIVTDIKVPITPEQAQEIARLQFQVVRTLFNQQRFGEAADRYIALLTRYPEILPDSVFALGELARSYIEQWDPMRLETGMNELYADMVVGYLAERFSTKAETSEIAGDELNRIITLYGERKQEDKKQQVSHLYLTHFPNHPFAVPMLMSAANYEFVNKNYSAALELYTRIATQFPTSPLSINAMLQMSRIHRMDSEFASEAAILERALGRVDAQIRPGQNQVMVRYMLAQALRDLHIPGLRDEDSEVVKESNDGVRKSAQFYEDIIKMLSPGEIAKFQSTPEEIRANQNILEGSLFARAFCMSMLTLPADQIPEFRRTAAQTYG